MPKEPEPTISPWKLTAKEAQVMDAVCAHGCQKLAGRALDLSADQVKRYCQSAGEKIGMGDRLTRYLRWDRWRHGVRP
jgi:FixJ family two-component response regulator